ncbi:MAG: DUF4906 domain-containing protein [Bacteroides sp.]
MKSFKLIHIILLVSLLASCTEELCHVIEGQQAQLKITFNTGSFPIETLTRAETSETEENKVHNLYVLVFNADGTISGKGFFDYNALQGKVEGNNTTGWVTVNTTSGEKTIYAIANIDDKQPIANIAKSTLDNITNKQQLAEIIVGYKDGINTILRVDGKFLMSGSTSSTIQAGANNINLQLKRVCSKIRFTINSGAGISFTPTSWRVMRVPRKVKLTENTTSVDGNVTADNDFFDTENRTFEGTGNTFVYYQYENRKGPKLAISETGNAAYKLREKQTKTGTNPVLNGDYVHADKNATYIIIKGRYEKAEGNGASVIAEVSYVIHLGYINSNPNDFNCLRNNYYQYTVTINGVNDITTEAQATDASIEPSPNATGTVIKAKTTYMFDAHYVTCVIKLPRESVTSANSLESFYSVKTPFDISGKDDIGWVTFLKNSNTDNASRITPQAYPGKNNDLLMSITTVHNTMKNAHINNTPGFYFTDPNDGKDYAFFTAFVNEYYYEQHPITGAPISWKEFVNKPDRELMIGVTRYDSPDKESSLFDNIIIIRQKSIRTIYDEKLSTKAAGFEVMDENWGETYSDETASNKGNTDFNDGWKNSCLDWELITGDPRTAAWTQAPVRRWDNYINSTAIKDPAQIYGGGTNLLVKNGIIAPKPAGTTQNTARYACMARNRDLNGNGFIDKDEVRWYTPAVNQLINIWYGSSSIMREDQMYRLPEYYTLLGRLPYVLYLTSTANSASERSNPKVLWSKEGTSVGPLSGPVNNAWLPMPPNGSYGKLARDKFYTRCMRNLHGTVDEQPADIVTYTAASRTVSLVDPALTDSRIKSENYRNTTTDYFQGQYPNHTERSPENIPASKFQVASALLWGGESFTWTAIRGTANPAKSCRDYFEDTVNQSDKGTWRMPNQRELQLMSRLNVIGPNPIWCASDYTYNLALDLANRNRAFIGSNLSSGVGLSLQDKGNSWQVRCIRDVK